MNRRHLRISVQAAVLVALTLAAPSPAAAQKVFLNPSNQVGNPVSGGGSEADYALANALVAANILEQAGFQVVVDADFTNAPANANSWGADIFVSIHSNAGGGHGTETLYKTTGGQALATSVQEGMLSRLSYRDRGLVQRDNLWVLNQTAMLAALAEAVFHDCVTESGLQGHPPSESAFLRSTAGQAAIGAGIAAGICTWFGSDCTPQAPTTGILKGVVYRAPDLADRIAGATVSLDDGSTTTASATGYWEFELEPGTYIVTASAEGYEPASTTRAVGAGDEVWGSIGLVPVATLSDPDADVDAAEEAMGSDVGDLLPDLAPDVAEEVGGTDDVTNAEDVTVTDVVTNTDVVTVTDVSQDDAAGSEIDLNRAEDAVAEPGKDAPPEAPVLVLDATGETNPTTGRGGCLATNRPAAGALPLLLLLLLAPCVQRRRD